MNNFLKASCSGAENFFPLPNVIFSLGLSTGELAVYAYLMYCEDRKSHQCWPSYKTIWARIRKPTKRESALWQDSQCR